MSVFGFYIVGSGVVGLEIDVRCSSGDRASRGSAESGMQICDIGVVASQMYGDYPMNACQRRKLWATATKSATVVTLASPRTLNWDTP